MVVKTLKKQYGEDEPALVASAIATSSGPITNGVTAGVIVFFITRLLDRVLFGRKP